MAMEKHLHVVAFNTPYPADYGGVIDVYHRLRALHEAGVGVVLHCFEYGRRPAPELEAICSEVHYYHRRRSPLALLNPEPFIVATRRNTALRCRLMQDRLPILLEGVHCSSLLLDAELKAKHQMWLRMHNIESDYYTLLAQSERSPWQRFYLSAEARKLRSFEPRVLRAADRLFAISAHDADTARDMGLQQVELMPPCLPGTVVRSLPGIGHYALYHGNLEVAENHRVADDLLRLFAQLPYPLVVAGHHPPEQLVRLAAVAPNLKVIGDPSESEMQSLIANAHICLMFTHQSTGLKLKLLRSLAEGRHCIANPAMAEGTGLETACHVVENYKQIPDMLAALRDTPFTDADITQRTALLGAFDSQRAIQPLLLALRDYTISC